MIPALLQINCWVLGLLHFSVLAKAQHFTTEVPHANHIFNAVHSSMRLWGSSLNHNGMSTFIVTVPKGIELYFGGSESDRINGTEWLAFDAELASWSVREHPLFSNQTTRRTRGLRQSKQITLKEQPGMEEIKYGYLHTYRTRHDLRLLYIDGLAATLSDLGTSDLQDMVLLHGFNSDVYMNKMGDPLIGGTPDIEKLMKIDYARGDRLCSLALNEWKGRIDGFLRSQWGHEIILCSFAEHLDLERMTVAPQLPYRNHGETVENFAEFQALARRFDGIGVGHARVSYDSFVTLFADDNAFSFNARGLPRVNNETETVRKWQRAIKEMVLSEAGSNVSVDWQAVTDSVVSRYSNLIGYLASKDMTDFLQFQTEMDLALRPFIDFGTRNQSLEIERCARQYHSIASSPLAARAVLNVTTTLCSALSVAGEATSLEDGQAIVRELKEWLGWTTWKRCQGCEYHEVCFIPIFPLGGERDHEWPRCLSDLADAATGYWDV